MIKKHPTIPDLYVTDDGRLFRELPASVSHAGYHTVKLGAQTIRRHTLVAETFLGPRPNGQEVRHLNGKAGDDRASNLAYGTHQANAADAIQHGTTTRGVKNTHAKLTEAQARAIKQRRAAGESGRSLAEEFGVSQSTVCDIHTGRVWAWLA